MRISAWQCVALVQDLSVLCTAAVVQNQFDSIDLSDNAIVRLEGFPKLQRLKSLHLSNNRIARIGRHLEGGPPAAQGCRGQGEGHSPAAGV